MYSTHKLGHIEFNLLQVLVYMHKKLILEFKFEIKDEFGSDLDGSYNNSIFKQLQTLHRIFSTRNRLTDDMIFIWIRSIFISKTYTCTAFSKFPCLACTRPKLSKPLDTASSISLQ